MWSLTSIQSSFNFHSLDAVEQNFLTFEELDLLEGLGDTLDFSKGEIGIGEGVTKLETRNTDINWLDTEKYDWFYRRCTDYFNHINQNIYKFELTYMESLQYSVYNEGQHYKSHVDMQPATTFAGDHRKLSFSIQLTDENSYEGSDLIYYTGSKDEGEVMSRKRGMVNIFPSYALHKVTPIIKGQRRCIVGWLNGPRFK